jgi:hypothetical protein
MIDFSKITKTVSGLDCRYLGQRKSNGQVLNRFAIFNDASEVICYYNEQGQRVECDARTGKWVATPMTHQIIAPPKIIEVTRWVGLFEKSHAPGKYFLDTVEDEQSFGNRLIAKQQHTFRFEVPNE